MTRRHVNSGAPAEILTILQITQLGWTASLPFGAKAPYDIIADTCKRLIKLQVKTIYRGKTDNGEKWMVDFLRPRGMRIGAKKYTSNDCDAIIAVCPEKQRFFVFPIKDCCLKRQATFYFDEPSSKMARNINWVSKFEDAWHLLT